MTTLAKPVDVHRTWRAGRVLLALTSVFAAIAVCGVVWLAVDLYAVGVAAGRLQDETVPWTIERQRLGRNLEQLRLEGQRVLTASSPASRQDALFLVYVLSAQPGMAGRPGPSCGSGWSSPASAIRSAAVEAGVFWTMETV